MLCACKKSGWVTKQNNHASWPDVKSYMYIIVHIGAQAHDERTRLSCKI